MKIYNNAPPILQGSGWQLSLVSNACPRLWWRESQSTFGYLSARIVDTSNVVTHRQEE